MCHTSLLLDLSPGKMSMHKILKLLLTVKMLANIAAFVFGSDSKHIDETLSMSMVTIFHREI